MLHRRLLSAFVLIAVSLFLIGLDLWFPIAGQAGVWMIPLYLFMTLGTAAEVSQLLAKRWPIQVSSVITHCSIASVVMLFPIWYSVVMSKTYPTDCPVGRTGWVIIGLLSGIGSSGLEAMWRFSKIPFTLSANENAVESERTTLGWLLSSFVLTYVVGCLSFWFLVFGSNARKFARWNASLNRVACDN